MLSAPGTHTGRRFVCGFFLTHVLHMRLLGDAEDLGEAVVEIPEQLRGFDGHPSQKGVQSLRVEHRLQGQRLADVTVASDRGGRSTVQQQQRPTANRNNNNGSDNVRPLLSRVRRSAASASTAETSTTVALRTG